MHQENLASGELIEKYMPDVSYHPLGEMHTINPFQYKGFCIENSMLSNEWKIKLIQEAKHNVVLSGCYCGGEVFRNALDVIEQKCAENPQFKVYLICSQIWLSKSNNKSIFALEKKYPKQFFATVTNEKHFSILLNKQKLNVSCNHIKALITDYGKYFMIGGSGLEDKWSKYPGDQSIPKAPTPFYLAFSKENLSPLAFRDTDFIFEDKYSSGIGKTLYIEMLKHITKWQIAYNMDRYAIVDIPTPYPEPRLESEIALPQETVSNLKIAAFLSGPDIEKNTFVEMLIDGIRNAKENIYINHLYFHPPKRLLQALINASNRGVNITLVTNSQEGEVPWIHYLFAALSKMHYQKLFESRPKENVQIYEFNRKNVTLHKKIIIIDGKRVYTGSSNIGYTSMQVSADYELDMIIESEEFAQNTYNTIKVDHESCARKIPYQEASQLDLKTKLLAPCQANFEFLL